MKPETIMVGDAPQYVGVPESEEWSHVGDLYFGHGTTLTKLACDGAYSPSGFGWSYQGSGPKQTARAILAHHLGYAPRHDISHTFCIEFVVGIERGGFTVTSEWVAWWCSDYCRRLGVAEIPGEEAA